MKKAYLQITTWKGTLVWYAAHYYGCLRFGDERVDLQDKLTEAGAKRFNKAERDSLYKYKAGDETDRFSDEEKLIKSAIELFKKDDHGYEILLKGDNSYCDPKKVLAGSPEIMVEANKLFDQYEENGGWDCINKQKIERICEQWDLLVGPVWEK